MTNLINKLTKLAIIPILAFSFSRCSNYNNNKHSTRNPSSQEATIPDFKHAKMISAFKDTLEKTYTGVTFLQDLDRDGSWDYALTVFEDKAALGSRAKTIYIKKGFLPKIKKATYVDPEFFENLLYESH